MAEKTVAEQAIEALEDAVAYAKGDKSRGKLHTFRRCLGCGKRFKAVCLTARHCSSACWQRAYQERRDGEEDVGDFT